jgi:DNA-binding beta-propeller fold protein YncE
MKKEIRLFAKICICLGLVTSMGVVCRAQAQGRGPKFVVDPSWPKPLPGKWVIGQVSGVYVDAQDHVFIVNRNDTQQAPPYIEFDPDGNVVNSFGDWKVEPNVTHGCTIDYENNFWTAGNGDGIIQKYSHDGKLLTQIGNRGVVDTSDGTLKGRALNSSHTQFFMPSDIAVDPANGDVYVADGYGNSRIAVFDRSGKFLRQWGHQGTKEEAVVHCVVIDNDSLVYVCDRQSDRIQVFDKMGNFKNNIWIKRENSLPDNWGTTWWIGFSPEILEHASGDVLSSFGRPGHQVGAFTHGHTLAVDSNGNVYVAETDWGRRVQKFKPVK